MRLFIYTPARNLKAIFGFLISSLHIHPINMSCQVHVQTALQLECLLAFPRAIFSFFWLQFQHHHFKDAPWKVALILYSSPLFCPSIYFNLQLLVFSTKNKLMEQVASAVLFTAVCPTSRGPGRDQAFKHSLSAEWTGSQGSPWGAWYVRGHILLGKNLKMGLTVSFSRSPYTRCNLIACPRMRRD